MRRYSHHPMHHIAVTILAVIQITKIAIEILFSSYFRLTKNMQFAERTGQ
jgi:hypothetical protein